MSMHTEWDTATACEINAAGADELNTWGLDEDVTLPYGLALGGGGGGMLMVEGTRAELMAFAERVLAAVRALPGEDACNHDPAALTVVEAIQCECGALLPPLPDEDDVTDIDPATRDPYAYPVGYDQH